MILASGKEKGVQPSAPLGNKVQSKAATPVLCPVLLCLFLWHTT